MLKKVVSILLAVSMILSLVCVSYAADGGDGTSLETLKALQIVRGYDKQETKTFSKMTKAAFITFLMNMTDDEKYSGAYDTDALKRAEELGIIDSAASVGEEDVLKSDEAVKMAMCLLGYKEQCIQSGGYPAGYITRAQSVGLTRGVKLSAEVKNGEAFDLLAKVIETDVAEVSYFGEKDGKPHIKYEVIKDRTILNLYRHIYTVEGIVTANKTSGLYDFSAAPAGKVKVDGDVFDDPSGVLYDYLGCKVLAYAREKSDGNYEVMWSRLSDDTKTAEFKTSDIKKISDDLLTFEYYPNEKSAKTKRETVSASAALLYNGALCTEYSADDFKRINGKVTLIKNNSDKADVIKLDVYDTMIVSSVSASTNVINSEFTYSDALSKLNLDDYDYEGDYVEIILDGEGISIADIKPGDVLSVLKSETGENKSVKIYAARANQTVTVTSYDENKKEVSDGTDTYALSDFYFAANEAKASYAETISPGSTYTLYMDINGEVVGAKAQGGSLKAAWLKAVGTDKASALSSDIQIRIFGSDGVWQTLSLADKIELNGASRKTSDVSASIYAAADGLIEYELNKEGKVSRLETPISYYDGISADRLNTVGANSHVFRYSTTSFDCYHYMTGSTKVIIVPSDDSQKDNESLYDVGNNYSFSSNTTVSYVGYGCDEYYYLDYVVVKKDTNEVTKPKSSLYLVRKISKVSGESGDTLQAVLASKAYFGLTVKAKTPSVLSGINPGDVIQMHINRDGYADNAAVVYRVSNKVVKEMAAALNSECTVKGVVLKTDPTGGRILVDSEREIGLKIGSISVLVWDDEAQEVSVGSVSDINIGDYVIADIDNTEVKGLYIFRNFKN